jgi:hypothetical protein
VYRDKEEEAKNEGGCSTNVGSLVALAGVPLPGGLVLEIIEST